ncbi:hypothetical protein [Kribbella sp. CA-247076]|uniref:hypothetical protein n=1 Tax=Kribbella sp. CA-247076 TaxID=3239941 RepID=UPI003D91B776
MKPRTLTLLLGAALLTQAPTATAAPTHNAVPTQTAVPGLHLVKATSGPGSPAEADASAECSFGEHILGVGGELVGARGQAGLSTYTHIEREWGTSSAAEDADGTTAQWTLNAYAICTTGPHRQSVSEFSAYSSPSEKAVTVTCPPGTVTTGAAGSTTSGGRLALDDVIPSADLTKVTVGVYETQGGRVDNWHAIASARCGEPLPGLQRVSATSPANSVSKSVTATCPAGKKVVGTGHELLFGRGQVLLDDVVPSADLTSVRVEAYEDQDGTAANWSVTAYAVCANA